MKKIFTLAIVAFFCSLGMMAQVELGNIKFSLGEGKKISPKTGVISVSFPNATGLTDEEKQSTEIFIEGKFSAEGHDDEEFDGSEKLTRSFDIALADYELSPKTDYTLTITSVKINNQEFVTDENKESFVLHFQTRSAERKMSWTFVIDEESSKQIVEEASTNIAGSEGEDVTKYMDIQKNGSSTKRYYVPAKNYEEITLPDGSVLPMTEDLLFRFGNKGFYVGKYNDGTYKDRICFNNNNQFMVIPDCQEGDVITLRSLYATKNKGWIQAVDGCALAVDGLVSNVTNLKDSVGTTSSAVNYKFEVQRNGDVTLKFGNSFLLSIEIEAASPKVPRNYNIVAAYTDSVSNITLKELVAKTEETTGSTIKVNYPYWLVDTEGNAYTHGSKGVEFAETFDLKWSEGVADTTFVINYAKTDYTGVVYLSEGEDIEGAEIIDHANTAIRSSMGKAAYVTTDTKLVSLEPGTYKIRAVLFSNEKAGNYSCVLTKGATEADEIYLNATADNWTEAESDLLTITETADITLLSSLDTKKGVDVIMIYASEDDPEDPEGIVDVNADAKQTAVRKVMQNGKILIVTKAGAINVAGQLVK